MMSVRVRDVSIPVSKVDLRPDPAGITRVSNLDPTTVTWSPAESGMFWCLLLSLLIYAERELPSAW